MNKKFDSDHIKRLYDTVKLHERLLSEASIKFVKDYQKHAVKFRFANREGKIYEIDRAYFSHPGRIFYQCRRVVKDGSLSVSRGTDLRLSEEEIDKLLL